MTAPGGVFDHLRLHQRPCPPNSHCEWDAALDAAEKAITADDSAGDLWHEREGWNAALPCARGARSSDDA